MTGKPRSAAVPRSGDGPGVVKRGGRRAEARPICWGTDHEEAEAHEGQVGHRDINRDLMTRTDSHADEGPEDDERRCAVWP